MKYLADLPITQGASVLVRAALNVPVHRGNVLSSYRARAAVPTISYLASRGARVVVIGHIGNKEEDTLAPVASFLKRYVPTVRFVPFVQGVEVSDALHASMPGDVVVLENLRRHRGEKHNDAEYVRMLASYGDFFVQDAFDACHRLHASIVGIPKLLPSYAGLLLEREISHLTDVLSPTSPSLAIFGGAKFATKIPALRALLPLYDEVFVGGAVLHDLLLARGYEIGRSLSSRTTEGFMDVKDHPKLLTPSDVVVVGEEGTVVRKVGGVKKDDVILDAGPDTISILSARIQKARTVVWNGPLGNYERGFDATDKAILTTLATSKAFSVVGGGDTVASIEDMGLERSISFVSTGGGAMLEFLAKKTLPGIEALY